MSRTDDPQSAAAGNKDAWLTPVVISKQSSTTFSDKEQIWADNASSSNYFGTVYVCWAAFRGQELSPNAAPAPLIVGVSHDGGDTWTTQQITAAANNGNVNPMDGCTVRTDSSGTAYVFGVGTVSSLGHQPYELMSRSTDGGASWSSAVPVIGPVSQPGEYRPFGHRRPRRREERSRSRSEHRHRQWRTDGLRRNEPDRAELRQWRPRETACLLR